MDIDWITVVAQVVNFLILVYLLKRFLYGPIIRAMDKREERITKRLEDASQREDEADARAQEYREKREALEEERERRLEEAREQAEQERKQRVEEARDEIEAMKQEWRDEVEREKTEFLDGVRKQAFREVTRMVRRILDDLAGRDLEHEIVRVFNKRLQHMDEDTREALRDADDRIEVLTAFELDDDNRRRLGETLQETLGRKRNIEFTQSGELQCGIALRAGGRKISWSVGEYLDALDERIQETLQLRNETAD
ncbi:F0F1 ATP synthase subunit delta [Thioalkalivibrio sp.]|uniref:F0F1 ATP synthase subunit delta n=1 Tax=Thioalkalivibrio sp. TaxID=2093813 RepID=UPI003975C698